MERDELKDLAFQQEIEETEHWAKRVKMTEQQKADYKLYRKGCRLQGVEPVRADFLAGDIPSCVQREMVWEQQQMQQPKAMGAVAGR